jgi:TRAP-type mannitol/chloroaromatic compound transport system permease small subunit
MGGLSVRAARMLAGWLDAVVEGIGRLAAWLVLPLIAVILFDVVSRRWFVLGSTALQELEWHLHTALFALVVGWAYVRGAHVRIDLVRERLGPRPRVWIELLGCLLSLLPFTLVTLHFSLEFAHSAYALGERSASASGLGARWVIKAILALGLVLMLLAGLAVLLRQLLALLGPPDERR